MYVFLQKEKKKHKGLNQNSCYFSFLLSSQISEQATIVTTTLTHWFLVLVLDWLEGNKWAINKGDEVAPRHVKLN